MAIIEDRRYSDEDYDLKESLLSLVRSGLSFDEAALIIGLSKEKVIKWLRNDREFNRAVMKVTER